MAFGALLLLLAQALPLFQHRWVVDESWYSIPGFTYLQEGAIRNPTFAETDHESKADMRPPAMPLTHAAVFGVFGPGVWQARLPSLIASVIIVLVTFLLASRLAGPIAASLAAFLVATNNFLFLATRTARPEA